MYGMEPLPPTEPSISSTKRYVRCIMMAHWQITTSGKVQARYSSHLVKRNEKMFPYK